MEHTIATDSLLGASAAIQRVRQQIQILGPLDAPVLIEGEIGTGKWFVARVLHAASPRRDGPFLSSSERWSMELLLGSQWFGHARGALASAAHPGAAHPGAGQEGTGQEGIGLFEAARGGTLFLDDIADVTTGLQSALLRVLDERQVVRIGEHAGRPIDVRVLAATDRDIDRLIAEGTFRRDLFYRLAVGRIALPPLRDRPEDIRPLAMAFLRRAAVTYHKPVDAIGRDVMTRLEGYGWPGNIRELASTIERAVVRATDSTLQAIDLPPELAPPREVVPPRGGLSELERHRLLDALQRASGNRSAAARALGISRATLYRRLAVLTATGVRRSRIVSVGDVAPGRGAPGG